MIKKVQDALIDLSLTLNWKNANELRVHEDRLAKMKKPFVVTELTKSVRRYLALGSIPFIISENFEIAELNGSLLIEALWQTEWQDSDMIGDLIRRPTMPTGNLSPKYFVIGDAPGVGNGAIYSHFDRVFVYGPSSVFLRKTLLFLGIYYETWFTNLLKLSTPGNRKSSEEEVNLHKKMLINELELLQPEVIILLGGHATNMFFNNVLLGCSTTFLHRVKITSVYHPSHMVRQGSTVVKYSNIILDAINKTV